MKVHALLDPSWAAALDEVLAQPNMVQLIHFIAAEIAAGHEVFPPQHLIFSAFERTPVDRVRVVIVGQDPYHGPGQAMGLSFSVPQGVAIPPSLRNILKEIESDLGTPANAMAHGDLSHWSDQGVLLLNTSLTVRAHAAGSHAHAGWNRFTDAAIRVVNEQREHVVFLLWGRHAQEKAAMIDPSRHLVLSAPHPSPLSASKGFFGCRHFSRANVYLVEHGAHPIDWSPSMR